MIYGIKTNMVHCEEEVAALRAPPADRLTCETKSSHRFALNRGKVPSMLLPYLATALLSALGQDAAPAVQERGTIILYRPESIMGAAVACPIRYKGDVLVELGRGKYAEWSV